MLGPGSLSFSDSEIGKTNVHFCFPSANCGLPLSSWVTEATHLSWPWGTIMSILVKASRTLGRSSVGQVAIEPMAEKMM